MRIRFYNILILLLPKWKMVESLNTFSIFVCIDKFKLQSISQLLIEIFKKNRG